MEIKGKVTVVRPLERGTTSGGKNWSRKTIVVEYESGQYPKSVALTNMNKAEEFDKIRVGSTGTFKYDFKYREYNGRDYTDIVCWDWTIDGAAHSEDPI